MIIDPLNPSNQVTRLWSDKMLEEKENKDQEAIDKKKKKEEAEPDPFCTTAPSAEHARGGLEDDPCDDYREGE